MKKNGRLFSKSKVIQRTAGVEKWLEGENLLKTGGESHKDSVRNL